MPAPPYTYLFLTLSCPLLWVGCSADFYRQKADIETHAVLFGKTAEVENVENDSVDIEPPPTWSAASLDGLPTAKQESFLGSGKTKANAKMLSLDEALSTGITHNRSYLTRKEAVFLEALDLTLAQHRLSPIFGGGADATRQSDSRRAAAQAGLNSLVATNTFTRNQSASFDYLYKTGARLSADFTQDFLNFLAGSRDVNNSKLAFTLVQPLLKGGGQKTTLEALTQADRDVLYALRDFADFRRDFVVDLVSDYYRTLQARDNARNAYLAYQGFFTSVEREEALAEEDRRTQAQLGQLKQATLLSKSRWLRSIRSYESQLDELKLTLGIPVDTPLALDSAELDSLRIRQPDITPEEAIQIALASRPDLATSRDRIDDAARKILVAEQDLKPGLDLVVDYETRSDPGDLSPDLNLDRRNIATGIDLDLPLDRKAERNRYRSSLITRQARERQHEEAVDRARIQINDDWRALELAEQNYEIALQGISLAQRRLEEQLLLAEIGGGRARDLVDAQEDLLDAQNQRTSTLIDHTLARLRLWRDLGILYIKDDGSWVERIQQEPSVIARPVPSA